MKLISILLLSALFVTSAFAKEVTTATFEDDVLKAPSSVLVEFYSPGCSICKGTKPVVEAYEKVYGDIMKVDLVANKALTEKYRPMNFPVFIVFKDGKEVSRFERPKSVKDIEDGIKSQAPQKIPANSRKLQLVSEDQTLAGQAQEAINFLNQVSARRSEIKGAIQEIDLMEGKNDVPSKPASAA